MKKNIQRFASGHLQKQRTNKYGHLQKNCPNMCFIQVLLRFFFNLNETLEKNFV